MAIAVLPITRVEVTLNFVVVAPAATVTFAGTLALLGLLLVSFTSRPPAGAGLDSVTVPTALPPPTTVFGLRANEASATGTAGGLLTGLTVNAPDLSTPE